MRFQKKHKKIIAVFLTLNFLQTLLPYNHVFASNNGPKSPEASTFEPVDSADMVNLISGDFAYSLPILNIPGPEGGYPLSLSYHSGIAMGQESSWVGLGWNINPGALNRSVSGVPDDWRNTKKYKTIYNQGGISTSYSGGVSVGWKGTVSTGIYASYTENKTFGGENSYGFDVGINGSIGVSDHLGLSGSIGTNGIGVGAGYSVNGLSEAGPSFGISASQSFKNGSTSVGVNVSGKGLSDRYAVPSASLGVSFNTKGGSFLTSNFGSAAFSAGSGMNNNLNFKNDNFSISIPFYALNFNFGYSRSRYWLFENDYMEYNGALYAGDMDNLIDESLFDWKVAFDSYQSIYSPNTTNQLKDTNFSYVGYDSYSATGQGVLGSIQPMIFEEGILYQKGEVLYTEDGYKTGGTSYYYPDQNQNGAFTNSLTFNNIHFFFNNENSSYLKVDSGYFNTPLVNYDYPSIASFNTYENLSSDIWIDGEYKHGYDVSSNRMRKGSFIEAFTNQDIKVASSSGNNFIDFFEAKGITGNRGNSFPDDGIGAYRITTIDGKTYHYSLPVYQREKFSKNTALDKNPNTEFYQESQFKPYATHWLLTAITGPDYVDTNGNHQVDKNDYGYWVEFEYGKWSDGYSWRSPAQGLERTLTSKQHQWGVKDLYYLDKIRTKSHTALFIKEVREDNQSININIRNGNDPKVYNDFHRSSIVLGDDGNHYFNGIYENIPIPFPINYYYVESRHRIYVKTNKHKTLKLNKIILLNNDNPNANISKSNSNAPTPILAGEIEVEEEFDRHHIQGGQPITINKDVHQRSWQGEFYNNVLDKTDVYYNATDIEDRAIKIIDLQQDYSLMPNSPNSTSTQQAKLTLNKVLIKGKNGTDVLPPYVFEYENPSYPYDNENKDEWGYGTYIQSWNLDKITTPLGEVLDITYEEDSFKQEAAITNYVFDENFVMKFTGEDNGPKYVTFKNNENNLPEQNIDFHNYFEAGQSSRVNVQYVWDPSGNGSERVADVDKTCQVVNVTTNTVKFQLPSNSVGNYERSQGICNEDNWQYYNWYKNQGNQGSVVQRTASFVAEKNADDCGEVNNGETRVKIQFYSSKKIENKRAGGLRVKDLKLTNGDLETYSTSYEYNIPNTNTSSGITSYEPSKQTKEVKYITELPAPTVMYEYVSVINKNSKDEAYSKDIYHFNVLKPMTLTSSGFEIDNLLSLTTSQNSTHSNFTIDNTNASVKFTKFKLTNNLSALGRLLSKKSYNKLGQLISEVKNEYKTNSEIDQGVVQESFKTYKKVDNAHFEDKYFLNTSTKALYPSVLKSTYTNSKGVVNISYFDKYDFLTGNILESREVSSNGLERKKVIVPAYSKYSQMGSKVDNLHNKNMLTQTTLNSTLVEDEGMWKPIGVGITTWSNDWTYTNYNGSTVTPYNGHEKIWRKHKSYIWDGNIDSDGIYSGYDTSNDDGFNWNYQAVSQPEPWKKTSETTAYNHYSTPVEVKDINNNYATTKAIGEDGKVLLNCNAGYGEAYYTGVEYETLPGNNYLDDGVFGESFRTDEKSHTGSYSAKITSDGTSVHNSFGTVLRSGKHRSGTYKISVWVYQDNYQNTRFKNWWTGNLEQFNGEKVFAGNWVQMNHYVNISSSQTNQDNLILISTKGGDIYVDDFRVHPIESSMTSYVYNKYDELTFVVGPNNLATKYQYDDAGRLIRIYEETVNAPSINGGFKLAKEYKYNYKRAIVSSGDGDGDGDDCNTAQVYFSDISENPTSDPSTARIVGPPFASLQLTLGIECTPQSAENQGQLIIYTNPSDPYEADATCPNAIPHTLYVQIPQEGYLDCSLELDNIGGDPQNASTVTIIETSCGQINPEASSFKDTDSFTTN